MSAKIRDVKIIFSETEESSGEIGVVRPTEISARGLIENERDPEKKKILEEQF
jgi:adenosine/AMP kinase